MICIFLHIYYPESINNLLKELDTLLKEHKCYLLINFVRESNFKIPDLKFNKNIIAISSPNKGKDIGGKLALLDLYLTLGLESEYMIFLHDKKSPHSSTGSFWREELYKIVNGDNVKKILSIFQKVKETGIIGSEKFIKNEWHEKSKKFTSTNNEQLKYLLDIHNFHINDFSFLAGTMFWIRTEIYMNFFTVHPPLNIRATLESGNVLDNVEGSMAHAWERMLSWIAIENKYKLVGI